jgi:hypothetical protein
MRSVRIFMVVGALFTGLVGVGVAQVATSTPAAAQCVTPQSGVYVGTFEGANATDTVYGAATYDITFTGSTFTAVVTYVEGTLPTRAGFHRHWHIELQHIHR